MDTFTREFKQNYLFTAIITILVGIVLVIWPDITGRFLCYVLGVALMIMGALQLIIFFREETRGFFSKFSMIMGLILIFLGIWVCVRPDTVLALVPLVIGIMMTIHGIMDIKYTMDIKNAGVQKWWIALLAALITLIFGILLILNPFTAFELTMIVIGFVMLYDGISDIVLMILARIFQRRADKRIREFAQNAESMPNKEP